METEYHWYRSNQSPSEYEVSYYKQGSHYGFTNEPDYKVIEKYDLRYIGYGDWDWLCGQHF